MYICALDAAGNSLLDEKYNIAACSARCVPQQISMPFVPINYFISL
jgi:hypothetical protein